MQRTDILLIFTVDDEAGGGRELSGTCAKRQSVWQHCDVSGVLCAVWARKRMYSMRSQVSLYRKANFMKIH